VNLFYHPDRRQPSTHFRNMTTMNLKDFLLNSVPLRKAGTALAASEPGMYDLFDGKSRYLCLCNALREIESDVENRTIGENTLTFLTELLAKCRHALDPQLSSTNGTKVPLTLRDVAHVTEEDDSMDADATYDDNSWADQMAKEDARRMSKPPATPALTLREVVNEAKKSPPRKAKKPKVVAKKATKPVGERKERMHKARVLIPLDFPVVTDRSLLSDKAFTEDHHRNVILSRRTIEDRDICKTRQGDWHPYKTCLLCDSFRECVEYYRKVGNEETVPENWLVRPSPYEYRLLVLAHAYQLSRHVDFLSFTENYKLLDLDVHPLHPTLESQIIPLPHGGRISVPDRFGKTVKDMAVTNHRYGLTELKRDMHK